MALTKVITHDGEFKEDGSVNVREVTRIFEDGKELSKTFHRHVVDVGDDVSNEPQIIKDICGGLHTPARIAERTKTKRSRGQMD